MNRSLFLSFIIPFLVLEKLRLRNYMIKLLQNQNQKVWFIANQQFKSLLVQWAKENKQQIEAEQLILLCLLNRLINKITKY